MSSFDVERRRKLNDEFENIFREHDRLQQDLNSDQNSSYQELLKSVDQWEEDAIRKIEKTARTARDDLQRIFKEHNQQLQRALNHHVTEELRDTLEKKSDFTEAHIDRWLAYLSEIRRQVERISSTVDFTGEKNIRLIKVKRTIPLKSIDRINLEYQEFNFETVRGHPVFYNTEHLISTARPAAIVSQNGYSTGTYSFRFRIEQTTDELFFGIISRKDVEKFKKNIHPIRSIHGWWNIDRRVLEGRKEPYVSSLNIKNNDEVIFILNCDAREIFLEYPSMTKLNSMKLIDDQRECSPPWLLLLEIGKPGRCLVRLLDWGKLTHGTNHPER